MKLFLSITWLVLLLMAFASAPQRAQTPPRQNGPDPTNSINAIKFSPDGRLVAIACGLRDNNRVELWDTASGTLLRAIKGFDGPVWSVSFSPDGRTLLTASSGIHRRKIAEKINKHNGEVFTELKWWDPQTGELKQRFELEEDVLTVAAQYSSDGKYLATMENRSGMLMMFWRSDAFDRSLRLKVYSKESYYQSKILSMKLLDAASGKTIRKLRDGFGDFDSLFGGYLPTDFVIKVLLKQPRMAIFSPNGEYVAGWNANELRLWNTADGKEGLKLDDLKQRLRAVAFSADGKLLAIALTSLSSSRNLYRVQSEIRLWDLPTGTARPAIPINMPSVSGLSFAGNDRQLLVSGERRQNEKDYASLEVVDLDAGSRFLLAARDEGFVSAMELSPRGDLMMLQTNTSIVKLVDLREWKVRFTVDTNEGTSSTSESALRRYTVSLKTVSAVAFLPDGKTVAGEVEGGGVKFWDCQTGEIKKTVGEGSETGSIAELSRNGDVLAEVNVDENVRLWNLASAAGTEISSAKRAVKAIALSSNGKTLGIAYPEQIDVYDAGDSAHPKKSATVGGKYEVIALSSDGRLLAGATGDGNVSVWNTADGTRQKNFASGPGVSAMRFSPNYAGLAIGMKDGRTSLWDLAGSRQIFESKKHSATVTAIAFSSEGTLMATGSDDRTAIVWEIPTGKDRRTFKGHEFTGTSMAFSADGNTLAVAGGNSSVALWDVKSGKLNRVLR